MADSPFRDAQPQASAQKPRSRASRAWLDSLLRRLPGRVGGSSSQPQGDGEGFKALFLESLNAIFIHHEGLIAAANPAAARMFGYADPQSMVGLWFQDLTQDPATLSALKERMAATGALPLGSSLTPIRYRFLRSDGSELHVRVTSTKDLWNGHEALYSQFQDETTVFKTEEALRESESLLQGVFHASPFAISVSEPDTGVLRMANAAYCTMIGWPREDIIGRSSIEIGLWQGGAAQRGELVREQQKRGDQSFFQVALRRRDGEVIQVHGGTAFVGDPAHPLLLFVGADVSETLRKQEELEAVMRHAPVAILVTEGGIVRSASPRLSELAGIPDFQAKGLHVSELWQNGATYDEIRRGARRQLDTQGRVELVRPHTRPDGTTIQLRVEGSPLRALGSMDGAFVWILSDITAEIEAFRAREVAEASSQAKTAFLAVMSHELRTPLNGILGLADLARARDTKAAERKEYLNQLADCAHSLADILNDILDLSKIEAGRMEIHPEAVDLPAFFARLQSTYTSLAEARGLELKMWVDEALPRSILIDPQRLRQILANYLGNALKFTPHGQIELCALVSKGRLQIEVRDSGIGIPPDLLPRLFTPFEQARDTSRTRAAGTGLGLAICHQLAHLMGGTVGASSEPGAGSRFWVELPLTRPDAHAVARAQEALEQQEIDLGGVRVLLAEDNEVNALITMRALRSAGAQALRVADGMAALEAAEEAYAAGEPFAVVLMDVQMPVMDGLQATRELRMRACGEGVRIVALTAGALSEQREECRRSGMDAYLTKPLHRERLLSEVLLQSKLAGVARESGHLGF